MLGVMMAIVYLYLSAGVRLFSAWGESKRDDAQASVLEHQHKALAAAARAAFEPWHRAGRGAAARHDPSGRAGLHRERPAGQLKESPVRPAQLRSARAARAASPPTARRARSAIRDCEGAGAASLAHRVRLRERHQPVAEGERRLSRACPEQSPLLQRIADTLVVELRKRLGGRFSAEELAELYGTRHFVVSAACDGNRPGGPMGVGFADRDGRRLRALPARGGRLRRRALIAADELAYKS